MAKFVAKSLLSSEAPVILEPSCVLSHQNARQKTCCQGKGFVVDSRGPFAHAQLCPCVQGCQACLGSAQIVKNSIAKPCKNPPVKKIINIMNDACIPARYAQASLDKFANKTGNGHAITEILKEWLQRYSPSTNKGLILSGPVGVGKTFLLASLAKSIAEKGVTVKFIDFFQLLSQIKAAYSENKADQLILEPLIAVDVLIIDELGKGRHTGSEHTSFELTILDQLVMGRYNQSKTILASTNCTFGEKLEQQIQYQFRDLEQRENLSFGSLEKNVGPRIYSRLHETTQFLEMDGSDYRKQMS